MTNAFLLTTEMGRKYLIVDNKSNDLIHGAIIRLDMPFSPSGQWLARCIYNSRGTYLGEWRAMFVNGTFDGDAERVRFKNGKCRYFLGDFDHGTNREWGDGIWSVAPVKAWQKQDGTWDYRSAEIAA